MGSVQSPPQNTVLSYQSSSSRSAGSLPPNVPLTWKAWLFQSMSIAVPDLWLLVWTLFSRV